VLAGIVATYGLTLILGSRSVPAPELAGAGLILGAIAVLAVAPALKARRAVEAR